MISAVILVCSTIGIPLHVFVSQKLWGWYVTPEFGIDPPSLLFFYGAALLVSMFKNHTISPNKDSEEVKLAKAFAQVALPLLFLLLGWLGYALFGSV